MDISYLGHSSFRIKGKTGILVTDPFDPEVVGLKYPKTSADIVTLSHQHKDHNFIEGVKDFKKIIDGPGEYEILGVSVIGIQTFHDDKKGRLRGKNILYIFEIEGMRIAHLGDLGHKLSEEALEEMGSVDILMIPVGGVYTLTSMQASEVAREIDPSIIIPMHYRLDGMNKEIFEKLSPVEDFLKELGLSVERLDKLSIKRQNLGEEKKVVVLERRV